METNLSNMEANLNGADKLKHQDDIKSNRDHLNSLKDKNSSEWREYATQCMIEIMNNKTQNNEQSRKSFYYYLCIIDNFYTLYLLRNIFSK